MLRTVDLLTRTRQLCLMADSPAAAKERPVSNSLMTSRRFAPLFWCQFFSAFNDNFLKNALVFLILFKLGGPNAEALVTLAGAVFIGPFFFLSGIGGELADRYDKAVLARRLKLAEIGAAGLAVVGFCARTRCRCCSRRCSFRLHRGPVRPDQIRHPARCICAAPSCPPATPGRGRDLPRDPPRHHRRRLAAARRRRSGLLRRLVIWLRGAVLGSRACSSRGPARRRPILASTSTSCARPARCCATSGPMRGCGAAALIVSLVLARRRGDAVDPAAAGEEHARRHRGGRDRLLAVFSVGIAVGSGLAAWLAQRTHRAACRRRSARSSWALFGLDLAYAVCACGAVDAAGRRAAFFARSDGMRIAIDFAGLAIAGGLFIVPSFAAVQAWAGPDRRARVIAAVNVLTAAFMVGGRARHRRRCRRPASTLPTIVRGARRRQRRGRPDHLRDACRRARSAISSRSSSGPSTGSR